MGIALDMVDEEKGMGVDTIGTGSRQVSYNLQIYTNSL